MHLFQASQWFKIKLDAAVSLPPTIGSGPTGEDT